MSFVLGLLAGLLLGGMAGWAAAALILAGHRADRETELMLIDFESKARTVLRAKGGSP